MLDAATGELFVESIPAMLGPRVKRRDLASLAVKAESQIVNEPDHSYSLGKQQIGGHPFWIVLYFYGSKLEAIDLSHASREYGTAYNDRPPDGEERRKAWHDKWLIEQIGHASHNFPWGGVASDYDPRSDCSSIIIRYSWQGMPWRGRT